MSERQDSPSSGASRHLLPRAKAAIGFSSMRSCHEVTDEVKSYGMMLPAAVCGHTELWGVSILGVGRPHAAEFNPSVFSAERRIRPPKSEAMCGIQKNPCGI